MLSTQQQIADLKTVREIAIELGKPSYSIAYLIQTRNIPETRRVGIVRLYGPEAVEQIKAAAAEVSKPEGQ